MPSLRAYQHLPRVRYNAEYFGYLVAFPDGEICLASESAAGVIHRDMSRAELAPHLLDTLDVRAGFHLNTPPLAWLELTRRCNLACPHCYIDGGRSRQDEMSTTRWHALLEEMAGMGVWAVAFTGGEPTLHPAFADLVHHARQLDLLVGVATHGMFLTDKLLDQLPRDGVIISVSLDDLHFGRGRYDFPTEKGMEAILRAREHGFLTNAMTNTHRLNVSKLPEIVAWAKKNRVSVRSVPFTPIGRGKAHRYLENTLDDVEGAGQFWLEECEWEHEYHREAGLCVGAIFNYGLSLAYMTRRCSSGRFLCYVAANGIVYPCTMCAAESIFPSGSVASTDFASVWRAPWEIRELSWQNFSSTCEGCVINDPRYYCASRCPAMSYARHGTYFKCGASQFEIASTIYRTDLLEGSRIGASSNIPIAQGVKPS